MATVTSLTQAKIQELLAGWKGVELTQEELQSLVSQLWVNDGTQSALLDRFENETLPDLKKDLDDSANAVSDLNDQVLPALDLKLSDHALDLENLNTVDIPSLQEAQSNNWAWIDELNTVTLPALQVRLDANDSAIGNLNTTVLPELAQRLKTLEDNPGGGSSFDPTELENAIAVLEGKFPVKGDDIAAHTITANNILADTITALEIAARSITALEIAADTITANEIAADSITASEIAARTITALEIAADAITANEIAADSITASEIAARTITALEIFADTITANEIAAGTITAEEIKAGTITAKELKAHTITANEILADTITANEIAANAITANEIAAEAITAGKIKAGAITTDLLLANEAFIHALQVVDLTSTTLTGASIRTAAEGVRVQMMNRGAIGQLEFYGAQSTPEPAVIKGIIDSSRQALSLSSGRSSTAASDLRSEVVLRGGDGDEREVAFYTNRLKLYGALESQTAIMRGSGSVEYTLDIRSGGASIQGPTRFISGVDFQNSLEISTGGLKLPMHSELIRGFYSSKRNTTTNNNARFSVTNSLGTDAVVVYVNLEGTVNSRRSVTIYEITDSVITFEVRQLSTADPLPNVPVRVHYMIVRSF